MKKRQRPGLPNRIRQHRPALPAKTQPAEPAFHLPPASGSEGGAGVNATSYINVGLGAHLGSMGLWIRGLIPGEMLALFKKKRGCPIRLRIGAAPAKVTNRRASVEIDIERMTDAEHERVVVDIGSSEDIVGAVDPRRR